MLYQLVQVCYRYYDIDFKLSTTAGMPPSQRRRDPYRTPSPPAAKIRREARIRVRGRNIEDYGFTATKLVSSYRPRRPKENEMAAAEPQNPSRLLESELSSPGSICSVPSLSTTPSSAKSSEQQISTPGTQRGIRVAKRLKLVESQTESLKSLDLFLCSNDETESSEWHPMFPSSQFGKSPLRVSQGAIAIPNDGIENEYIPQLKTRIDHPNSNTPEPAPPKRHTCSLSQIRKENEISRSQCIQQPLSMRSVAAVVVLLQRYMKGRAGRYGRSSNYGEKAPLPRALLQESASTVLRSKNYDVTSWLLQSEDSGFSSDTRSVDSLESDLTDDDSEEGEVLWSKKRIGTHVIQWERRLVLEEFMEVALRALCHLPKETVTKTLAAVRSFFESWQSHLAPSTYAAESGTSSSFNVSKAGVDSENTTSNSRGQKRPLDEDRKQPPNGDDNNPRKRQNLYGPVDLQCRQMWACPYYQREPHRYCVKTELGDFRKCAKSPGFPELHRVKGHIYKCHSPKYCDRCYTVFKNDNELTDHRRSTPACDVSPPQQIEGLTNEQKELLKPRDRSNRSEEERWKFIYKVCFPGDEVVPSPYFVHYSREVAELRREVLEIIQGEAQSPEAFNFSRLMHRVQEAFNAQQSAHGFAPPEPGILTPSTSNTSNTSNASGGPSNRATTRELYQRTPSLVRTTRQLASATGSGDLLQVPNSDELDEQSDSAMASDGPSMFPSFTSHFSETNEFPAFELPDECISVPFRGFTAPTTEFDFDQDPFDQVYSDLHDFDFPLQNPDDIPDL